MSVDGWMKYEPRLKGSVSAKTRQLTAKDNQLIVGISALKELKLSLGLFSWQLADEGFKPEPDPEPTPTPDLEPVVPAPTITSATTQGLELDHIDGDGEKATFILGTHVDYANVPVEAKDGDDNVVFTGTGNWSDASNSLEVVL